MKSLARQDGGSSSKGGAVGGGGGGGGGGDAATKKALKNALEKVKKLEHTKELFTKRLKLKGAPVDDDLSGVDDTPPALKNKKAKIAKYEMCGETEEQDMDSDGKFPKLLPRGHPWLKEWNKANPRKDDKFACWAFKNLAGGCPFGKSCKAYHST
jgi:hypothetical protein